MWACNNCDSCAYMNIDYIDKSCGGVSDNNKNPDLSHDSC